MSGEVLVPPVSMLGEEPAALELVLVTALPLQKKNLVDVKLTFPESVESSFLAA